MMITDAAQAIASFHQVLDAYTKAVRSGNEKSITDTRQFLVDAQVSLIDLAIEGYKVRQEQAAPRELFTQIHQLKLAGRVMQLKIWDALVKSKKSELAHLPSLSEADWLRIPLVGRKTLDNIKLFIRELRDREII